MEDKNTWCVYMHTSPSGKVYIGITSRDPEKRWENGKGYLRKRNGEYTQPAIARAIIKYGWENFKHEILFENLTQEEAEFQEQRLVELYRSTQYEFGYNIKEGGGVTGKFSEESRRRMSENRKGENNCRFGTRHSEETKQKIRESKLGDKNPMYGTSWSEERREQMRERMSGVNSPNYGKPLSEETKRKLSESHKGKYAGENSPNYGRHPSEETREKMRQAKLGKSTGRGRSVYCIELDRSWPTIQQAEQETGVMHIRLVLNGERESAGKHPVTGEKLHWIEIFNVEKINK